MVFLAIIAVLLFALYRSERRSTRIWLVCCIALNIGAIGMTYVMKDYGDFQAFETIWDGGSHAYTAD